MLGAWLFGLDHCLTVARGSMARGSMARGSMARGSMARGSMVARAYAAGSTLALDSTETAGNLARFFFLTLAFCFT